VTNKIGENIGLVVSAWTDMLRRGSPDALEALLDEKVVWEGVFPGEICRNRGEVLGSLSRMQDPPRITRMEAEEKGDKVMVSVNGPDFDSDDRRPAGAARSIVFTFEKGRVIKMQSLKTRDEAIRAAGLA